MRKFPKELRTIKNIYLITGKKNEYWTSEEQDETNGYVPARSNLILGKIDHKHNLGIYDDITNGDTVDFSLKDIQDLKSEEAIRIAGDVNERFNPKKALINESNIKRIIERVADIIDSYLLDEIDLTLATNKIYKSLELTDTRKYDLIADMILDHEDIVEDTFELANNIINKVLGERDDESINEAVEGFAEFREFYHQVLDKLDEAGIEYDKNSIIELIEDSYNNGLSVDEIVQDLIDSYNLDEGKRGPKPKKKGAKKAVAPKKKKPTRKSRKTDDDRTPSIFGDDDEYYAPDEDDIDDEDIEIEDIESFKDDDIDVEETDDITVDNDLLRVLSQEVKLPEYSRGSLTFREKGSKDIIIGVPMAKMSDGVSFLFKLDNGKLRKFNLKSIVIEDDEDLNSSDDDYDLDEE